MTQDNEQLIKDINKCAEIIDNQPVPTRDEKTIGMIIQAHMPIDEMTEEASDKDD